MLVESVSPHAAETVTEPVSRDPALPRSGHRTRAKARTAAKGRLPFSAGVPHDPAVAVPGAAAVTVTTQQLEQILTMAFSRLGAALTQELHAHHEQVMALLDGRGASQRAGLAAIPAEHA